MKFFIISMKRDLECVDLESDRSLENTSGKYPTEFAERF
jgi:hypothetical protein